MPNYFDDDTAFLEDAISEADIMGAAERFLVERFSNGIHISLYPDLDDSEVNLTSRDQVLAICTNLLEQGTLLTLGGDQ